MLSLDFDDLGEIVASLPYLIGFYPHDSLVLLMLGGPKADELGATLRVDLPPVPFHEELAFELLDLARRLPPVAAVIVVVVGGGNRKDTSVALPQHELVRMVDGVFGQHYLPVARSLWAPAISAGAPWQSYDTPELHGTLPASDTTVVAAMATAAGLVTYGSRQELAALLAADDEQAVASRAARIDELVGDRHRKDSNAATIQQDLRTVRDAVDRMQHDQAELSDETVAQLATALSDHEVRDACLLLPDHKRAAAERLWLALTKATPAPTRAEPAVLLALSAYLRGDGGLAAVALEVVEAADPEHVLGGYVRIALDLGITPEDLGSLVAQAMAGSGLSFSDDTEG